VGESEQALVQAFTLAREMAPCLLVLDNIDIILGSPILEQQQGEEEEEDDEDHLAEVDDTEGPSMNSSSSSYTSKKQSWRSRQRTRAPAIDRLLSTLLVEMDGLKVLQPTEIQAVHSQDKLNNNNNNQQEVLVIATATRINSLDKSLLRPGRLEEHIQLSLPSSSQRAEFWKIHLPTADEREIQRMVDATDNNTFAILRNVLTEAGMTIMRKHLLNTSSSSVEELVNLQTVYQQNLKTEVLNILHA